MAENGENDKADQLFYEGETSHGPTWLVGRHVRTAKEKKTGKSDYLQQITSNIKKEVAAEMEEKMNKKMQENMKRVLQKLAEVNPGFNLNIEEQCTINSSDRDENGTPVTQPTQVEGSNDVTPAR